MKSRCTENIHNSSLLVSLARPPLVSLARPPLCCAHSRSTCSSTSFPRTPPRLPLSSPFSALTSPLPTRFSRRRKQLRQRRNAEEERGQGQEREKGEKGCRRRTTGSLPILASSCPLICLRRRLPCFEPRSASLCCLIQRGRECTFPPAVSYASQTRMVGMHLPCMRAFNSPILYNVSHV
jgi:hypothetical protein